MAEIKFPYFAKTAGGDTVKLIAPNETIIITCNENVKDEKIEDCYVTVTRIKLSKSVSQYYNAAIAGNLVEITEQEYEEKELETLTKINE